MPPNIPLPKYLTNRTFRTERERLRAYTTFYLRLAALYSSPTGSVSALSRRIGYQSVASVPSMLRSRDVMSPEVAVAIERAVGRDVLPRELLRPDIFDL